ncbi:MAG: Asp-tRNA(Asn)/Glu-tRNA(Gln) amidotransferase subunit GatB [Vulcanimicrobiaceae bacterium]
MGGAEPRAERHSTERLSNWEAVIGLECHVELKTETKMFCGCKNEFGGEPNTKVCPVCLGLPGALPVPNKKAIELTIKAGLAFESEIPRFSKFDRKNYFYPDMPKDYQISQFDMPLCKGGVVEFWLEDGSHGQCRLTRIHLEEDTGKSTHAGSSDGRLAGSTYSLVDFNRAGVPLMECVSEPDLRTAEQAVAYLETLKRMFVQLGVSDVKMEEGSLRCDANVSIRPAGGTSLGTKTEIKNMNSFRSVRLAIESEIARQIELLESGGRVVQETRGWDEGAGVTHSQRSKEEAHDYRYFPDPDLVPLEFEAAWIDELRSKLPPPPFKRYIRYVEEYGLPIKSAAQLVDNPAWEVLLDGAVRRGVKPKSYANLLLSEVAKKQNEEGLSEPVATFTIPASSEFVKLIENGTITSKAAKEMFPRVWNGEITDPAEFVKREGLAQSSDRDEIKKFVDEVVAANADAVAEIRKGKDRALQFLLGQVMKASRGKANPALVNELLREAIGSG